MTSLVRLIRDRIRGILKDLPPDHSQITDIFYIGAWQTKCHRETILSLDVTLVIATILDTIDKQCWH